MEHTVNIIDNELDENICALADGLEYMRMTGWTADALPHPEHARISEVPLDFGVSANRIFMQALAIGTPTASTADGAQGIHFRACWHVLVSDNPVVLANTMPQLIRGKAL